MKKSRRIICMLLAVLMLASVLSISAFAKGTSGDVGQYDYYTVLGDSIASAYGTEAYHSQLPADVAIRDGNEVPGSYADIVAKAIGASDVNMRSHSGWRTTEFLHEIGYPGFVIDNDAYSEYYHSRFFRRALDFLPESELEGEGDRIINGIKNADFMTLNIGTNDIFSYGLTVTVNKFSRIFENSGILDIQGIEDLNAAFNELLVQADKHEMKGIITELVTAIETGFAMFRNNFPLVIDAIKGYNPDAKLVVLGLSNPINIVLDISEDVGIDLYTITDLLIDRVNYFLKTCDCADDYLFVDVTGTEMFGIGVLDTELLFAFDEDVKYSAVKMVHPNEAGHAFMAEQILTALAAEKVAPELTGRYSSIIKRNTLNWDEIDGAVKYKVYRSTSPDGNFRYIGSSKSDIYYDYLTLFGVTYYYKICAVMDTAGTITTDFSNTAKLRAR